MDGRRQKSQYVQLTLASVAEGRGEAPSADDGGTEPATATRMPESQARDERLMEEVCERQNMLQALKRVTQNRGSPGVDGLTVAELPGYLKEHWPAIRDQLLSGTYRPQPVKRVMIPKAGGGERQLGVPTVVDRLIQQAIMQVLQPRWDPTFSEYSFGFRPNRSAHQAVAQAQRHIADGYGYTVDIDLEKFFDRVNHDILMDRVATRETDKRLLKVIRAFLNAGVLENGLVSSITEGTPQGGPLSPLLSNLLLDDLDQELARRGHRFCRYADDCNIYVRSRRAGERVMTSICQFLATKLRLKVNLAKSAVARTEERQFLGFRIVSGTEPQRHIAPKAVRRFKRRVRELTRRTLGVSLPQLIPPLARYLSGWRAYYGFCQSPRELGNLDAWTRRRLRMYIWRQWANGPNRFAQLRRRGIPHMRAAVAAGAASDVWAMSRHVTVQWALPNAYFDAIGLPRVADSTHA